MSFRDCLINAVKAKELSQEEADQLNAAYENIRAGKRARMGDAAADVAARDELAARLTAEAAEKQRRAALTQAVTDRLREDLTGFRLPNGKADIAEAAIRVVENYGRTGYSSVLGRAKAIIGMAHAEMEGLLAEFGRTAVTGARKNKARLDNVVRELFGEGTGDAAARELASAWKTVSEGLRERFNAAGGAIAELKDWGLPQGHDRLAMMRGGKERWKAFVLPRLDPARMVNALTGEPMDAAEVPAALDHVWDSVIEQGWNTREPSRTPFGMGALASQKQDHRFLVFRNADAWLEYAREFGHGDPFATMMAHINVMARDIAALEVLGPNPSATMEWMRQVIRQEAAKAANRKAESLFNPGIGGARAADTARESALWQLDALWDQARGAYELPVGNRFATAGAIVRNWMTGARLGGAMLSALTGDPVTVAAAAKFMGLPAVDVLKNIARQLVGHEREAVAAGLILEDAQHVLRESARWHGALSGPEWSRRIPDRVLTWSGLQAWTQAVKHAFGREVQAFAGGLLDKDFAQIPAPFRRVMEGYGLGAREWEVMRQAVPEEISGAKFLRPQDIARVNPQARPVAERFLEMILQETEYAVPSGTARGRAMLTGRTRPGTIAGEIMRSAAMFKGFGVSVALMQGGRLAAEFGAGRGARGAAYAGAAVTTLTLGGMLGIWLKDIAKGRDPQPLSRDMAIAAMAQGGGFGIFGDFLFADYSRFGNSLPATLAGPGAAFLGDTWNLTGGNALELLRGKPTNFGAEAARWLRGNMPGGTIWYLNAAYQRVVMDQLQHAVDPKALQKFRQQVKDARRERDQGFWWAPGEASPARPPMFSAR
ncbi:hypothetical protein V5F49_11305 [Xanthobacter sp. V3C-3]|uniref:hypothetical protein n=1 Tax=Xanthobacter lutulentifluminis TaxID=3119935 RepID=UPI003728B160